MAAEGILLVDKEAGVTSADIVARVRRLFKMKKVGHTGTLDPFATGLLPVCLGRATAVAHYMLNWPKRYLCEVKLGYATDTMDTEGQVTLRAPDSQSWRRFLDPRDREAASELERAVASLTRITEQRAPLYSAVKVAGKPLYRYAREGREVERPVRPVTIYKARCLGVYEDGEGHARVRLECLVSAGAYIRSLAQTLGESLGCQGHAVSLRRLANGLFCLDQAVRLEEAGDGLPPLRAIGEAFQGWPRRQLTVEEARALAFGQPIGLSDGPVLEPDPSLHKLAPPPGDGWLACESGGRLVAVATVEEALCRPRRVFIRPDEC